MSKTAAQRRYMDKVAQGGCILPDCEAPADLHHPREFAGMGQRSSHWLVIPLCYEHHQGAFSIHATPRQFKNIYGSEAELLAMTIARANK